MVHISKIVARTPLADARSVDRAEMVLDTELLNLGGKIERAAVKEGKQGYLAVSIEYDKSGVTLDSINYDFGKILDRTSHKGLPVDLFSHSTRVVQLADSLYPNPMLLEIVSQYDDFSTSVPEGAPLNRKLGYAVVIRAPNDFPEDIRESLIRAVKAGGTGYADVSKLGEGYRWFHDIAAKRALVLPQTRENVEVGDSPGSVDFLDVRIEGYVREDQITKRGTKYDLMAEINEYFEGFREWLQGRTPKPKEESRNSVDRFLRDPNNEHFRRWLENQRREQEGIGRDEVRTGKARSVDDYLDAELDIHDMNSALNRTPPGAQLRPLLPYVFFRGVLFEEERPKRRVQHGAQSRVVTFYRVRYDGRFLTDQQREEAFSPKGAEFSPNIEQNSAMVL